MRNFLEDLGKRLGETAESVTNKAGEAMEIQKLKSQIRTLERENDSDLAELGLAVYDQFKSGTEVGEEAAGLCEAIQSREESIAECLQKISDVKGDSQCEDCGKTVGKGMAYCPFCGHKMPEIVEEEAVTVRLIYRLFLYGKSPSAIASYLTGEGIPTPAGKRNWRPNTVESILTNA